MKFSGILFDMDGTLIESKEIWFDLLRDASIHFGYEVLTREKWAPTFGQPQQMNIEMFMPELTLDVLQEYCNVNFKSHLDRVHVLDGAPEVVHKSNEVTKGRICIVTNCPRPLTSLVFNCKAGEFLKEGFKENYVCAEDTLPDNRVLMAKPSTALLEHAATRIGVDLSKCLMVGDSKFDIISGKAAGCYTIGINVDGGDRKISCIEELIQIISELDWE